MKVVVGILIFSYFAAQAQQTRYETSRKMYFDGWHGECGARNLVDTLKNIGLGDDPVLVAYKGAATTTLANCSKNPFTKLSVFNNGKDFIEAAVNKAPQNLEIRFIRFTVQTNIPALLSYDNTEVDKKFILEQLTLQPDQVDDYLMNKIIGYMKDNGNLSEAEHKQVLLLAAER